MAKDSNKEQPEDNHNKEYVGNGALAGKDKTVQAKNRMLLALKASLGVVSPALNQAQVGRNTYYQWIREGTNVYDPFFVAQVKELNNVVHDFAEHSLHKLILAGNVAATIFYCKTQMKHRGYIEKSNVAQLDGDLPPRQYLIVAADGIDEKG
jgi:hypothetical protein